MESTSFVRVVAAFVAGLVVALGSALIYVRVSDTPHAQPSQATTATNTLPVRLPEATNSESQPATSPPASMSGSDSDTPGITASKTAPARVARHPRFYTDPHLVRAPHVMAIKNAVTKSAPETVQKPMVIAQAEPVSPRPVAVPEQTTPEQKAYDPTPSSHDGLNAPAAQQPDEVLRAAGPQPHMVTLSAGTVLQVRLGETLSTDHNYTGDTFRGTLMTPVIQDGFIIADRGSKVLGTIVNAQSAGHMASVAALSMAVTEINTTDGQRIHVDTIAYALRGKSNVGSDAAKIAGGAALGALIGGLAGGGKGAAIGAGAGGAAGTGAVLMSHGPAAVVQSETVLNFRLANPLTIIEKLN